MNPSPAPDSSPQLPLFRARDRWVKRWTVSSSTDPQISYTVAVDAAGNLGCSCPAWVHDKERRPCKHLVAFRRDRQLSSSRRQPPATA